MPFSPGQKIETKTKRTSRLEDAVIHAVTAGGGVYAVDPGFSREPKPRPAPTPRKPVVDLETIRVLLYLSTSPRLTKTHRDACRDAAAALR